MPVVGCFRWEGDDSRRIAAKPSPAPSTSKSATIDRDMPVESPTITLVPEQSVSESRPLKVGFVSLGCPKNLVDSEVMMGMLQSGGALITARAEEADVIVVNTCSFIDTAKQESVDTILEMAQHKTTGRAKKLRPTSGLPKAAIIPAASASFRSFGASSAPGILNRSLPKPNGWRPMGYARSRSSGRTPPAMAKT